MYPTIEKIREVRHRISEEYGHDPQKLVNYYIELQKTYQLQHLGDAKEEPVTLEQIESAILQLPPDE